MTKPMVLKPRLSEKAYALSEQSGTYVFDIPAGTNRFEVAEAVGRQFKVGVKSVRLAATPGKNRRSYKRRGRVVHSGKSSNVRKAYVTLKEGEKLPLFAAVEEKDDKKSKEEAKS